MCFHIETYLCQYFASTDVIATSLGVSMKDTCLLDKENVQYVMHILSEDTHFFQAYIWWKRTCVGRINLLIEDAEMKICDLVIFNDPVLPRNGLFSFRPFQRPHRNFRACGLGNAMLQ